MGIMGRNGQGNDSHSVYVLNGEEIETGGVFPNLAYAYSGNTANTGAAKSSTVKFGSYSWYFDTGFSDYMTVGYSTGWDFGASDFTIDFWYRPNSVSTSYQGILGNLTESGNGFAIRYRAAPYGMQFFEKIGILQSNVSIAAAAFTNSVYTHCAFVRNQGVLSAYADGIFQDSDSSTSDIYTTDDLNINMVVFDGGYEDIGTMRVDGLRISHGIARWTSAFTPPARSY